ncbi:MAG TPA: sugar transferase [Ktedonobacteraceae bacterium]|jgi:lipopolysaccharide/colanic/teichoic acid biosynthesis glycosyltransferase|nr:sugar transferase [Ktedonobacteraceae bacterium]
MLVQSAPAQETISFSPGYLRAKRVLDIALTLLLLPFVGLVMIVVALLIRLDSEGPILFRQKRVGQDGVEFELLKFRSMYVNNDDASHRAAIEQFMNGEAINNNTRTLNRYKLGTDQRITRVGKFIRKTSLDELPQFFNVLRGEMSLVGPRPPVPYEVEHYGLRDRLRLSGKPGLTGTWQVYGRSRVSFKEMIEMDISYLQEQSLLLDCKLILLTVPVMLLGRGGA